jgi:hypothetical protein
MLCRTISSNHQAGKHKSSWTGNDASGFFNSCAVSTTNTPLHLELFWRVNTSTTPYLVGYYLLDLAQLLHNGLIRTDPNGDYRVVIYHDTNPQGVITLSNGDSVAGFDASLGSFYISTARNGTSRYYL